MTKGKNMKKPVLLTILTAAALAMASVCVAADYRVLGESLDSGLGDLPPGYTAAEFNATVDRILGESLDSGLGDLRPGYDASEYNQPSVPGEKLDSGLGSLTRADVMKYALTLPLRAETASAR
jgi:hypothetical protein